MNAIGKWLVGVVLGWLMEYLHRLAEMYFVRKQREKEREEDNKKAEQKLEEAESEQEIIDAGSDLLRR